MPQPRNDDDDEVSPSAETVPMTAVSEPRVSIQPVPATKPDPTADTTQGRRAVEERMQTLVAREERAKFRKRLRVAMRIGIPIWLAFSFLDVVAVLRDVVSPWWVLVVARIVPALYAGAIELHLRRRRDPSIGLLRFYEATLFGMGVAALGCMFTIEGGWTSPNIPLAALLLMGHGMWLGGHWRRAVVPIGAMVLALPATFLVASTFVEAMAAQLVEPEAMLQFAVLYGPVVGAAVISLGAGHSVWKLRAELAEAKSIGRYRLRRRIASGGMGEIWAAFHAGLRRDVAVKLIQPRVGEDQTAIDRFEREVRAMAELTHPNTIRVFDYGATQTGVWYYAMELLDAQDLQTHVAVEGRLEPERAVKLLSQAAGALGEAHERGIVHRDVKPANLLLVRAGESSEFVKLIDFGIAKLADADGLTQTGMVMGTPGYIAPEVITGGEATPRADVYALGMVLYFVLAGDVPFEGATPMAIVQQALEADPPPLREVRPEVPAPLEAVVARCLARDPFDRYATGTELAEALREL
ncbi:MAG TPA: serine/threonine-protein kinase [Sandaracinaceae bacterium LLY-WYZ-13_1]|nr:serine/threonine-protein kinase [Sandaracinaceae bacterium LLY-WYZ-13_1]